ncbi:glycosyltransferase family 4 protein [Pedococcus ginsenosidimutans]|uniref:Glycosyltransferase family 4 protein n=1 Tax=Pedococcus ginsenosidimutans TaxID=490570 RepID=A0ABP8YIN5_9MICO
MRILHVNKFLYRRGGAEGYMLDVVELQRRAGHEVELFGMAHPDNLVDLPLADTFPSHVELEPAPGGLAGLAAGARMVWSPSSGRGMARAIERFRPDVVHSHNVYHQLSPSVLAAVRRAGVRSVMTLHDYKLACPSYQMLDHGRLCDACVGGSALNAVRRRCKSGSLAASALLSVESSVHRTMRAYDAVDTFISPSRFLAGVMARTGLAPERLVVLNHFVEVAPVVPAAHREGFVFAGRLSPEKGVDTLIHAMALLPPTIHLHVAGDGPERGDLTALAARVAPAQVTFHGRLDKERLRQVVAGSVATVVPSRWHENQPMTILESYAAEVPAVVTDLGGMPELVRDGIDGLVVAHDDPRALADALLRLHADPAAATAMGRAGRQRLADEFDPQLHLRRLEAVYRGEVAEPGAGHVGATTLEGAS